MAQIILCGFGEGEKVQLKAEVNAVGKKKASVYIITKVTKPPEAIAEGQDCMYDLIPEDKAGQARNNINENELFQLF